MKYKYIYIGWKLYIKQLFQIVYRLNLNPFYLYIISTFGNIFKRLKSTCHVYYTLLQLLSLVTCTKRRSVYLKVEAIVRWCLLKYYDEIFKCKRKKNNYQHGQFDFYNIIMSHTFSLDTNKRYNWLCNCFVKLRLYFVCTVDIKLYLGMLFNFSLPAYKQITITGS